MSSPKAVVLLSGGLDSATAAAQAIADGYTLMALSVRYGQRHDRPFFGSAIRLRTVPSKKIAQKQRNPVLPDLRLKPYRKLQNSAYLMAEAQ